MKERFNHFFLRLQPVDFSTIPSFSFEVVRDHFKKTGTLFQIIEGDLDIEEDQEVADSDKLPLHKKIILRKLFHSIVKEKITEDQMDEQGIGFHFSNPA